MNAVLLVDFDDEYGKVLVPAGTRFLYDEDCEQQVINGDFYYVEEGEFELICEEVSGQKSQPARKTVEPLNTFELEHVIKALSSHLNADHPTNEAPDMTLDLIDRFATELADLRMAQMMGTK